MVRAKVLFFLIYVVFIIKETLCQNFLFKGMAGLLIAKC